MDTDLVHDHDSTTGLLRQWAWTVLALAIGFGTVSVWTLTINVATYHVERGVPMTPPAAALYDGWATGLAVTATLNVLTLLAIWLAGRRGPTLATLLMLTHICVCAGVFLIMASGVLSAGKP